MEAKEKGFEVRKKERNFLQSIWLPASVFVKVVQLADELGLAPNVVCSEIIKQYFGKAQPFGKPEPQKPVVQVGDRFPCPFCGEDYTGKVVELKKHIAEQHKDQVLQPGGAE